MGFLETPPTSTDPATGKADVWNTGDEHEIDLLPPEVLSRPLWRRLLLNLRDRLFPEHLPPLQLTSRPVDVGMLFGDYLEMPWYRSVFTNLGDVVSPEILPPLELESRPVDVGEILSDRLSHLWLASILRNIGDVINPEKLPPLPLTSKPVEPGLRGDKLHLPRWSSLISTPKVYLPDQPAAAAAKATSYGALRFGVPVAAPQPKPVKIEIDFTHVMVSQLRDDLTRSRLREAFWMSVAAHALVVLAIVFGPKYMPWLPGYKEGVSLITPEDIMRHKNLTYLELPSDVNKNIAPKPDTDVISDKNRVAQSRKPSLDEDTLKRLREMRRAGPPGPPAQGSPSASPPMMAQGQQPNPQDGGLISPSQNDQMARLQAPAGQANPFQQALSAGSAIQQATQAVAERRGGFSGGGGGGDYGLGGNARGGRVSGNLDVLSDTMGVDFGPYLARVVQTVRVNWYNIIPEVARPPLLKKGKVAIQFAILKDGRVAGMKLESTSGDVSLDRGAWGGITASNPFPPLPQEFGGPYLVLRFRFYYNPGQNDMD